tara:strand:- start:1216 stop:1683 length:468 start_codon:yes stop_codon:yes gene_type:complete
MESYRLNLEILWWSAILCGHKDTINELIQFGINPFISLNGQIGSEATIQFATRLKRMMDITSDMQNETGTPVSVNKSEKRLKNYINILKLIRNAEQRHVSKLIMNRFLRRYIRFMRRERMIRERIWAKNIFNAYTLMEAYLSPCNICLSYIGTCE